MDHRSFIQGIAGCSLASLLPFRAVEQQSEPNDHYATGSHSGVGSTSLDTSEAPLWAIDQGGNAADACITADVTGEHESD